MLDAILRTFVQCVLWLRYRIRVRGLEAVARRGTSGILFLPNHPGLIDPVIVTASLHRRFRPRPLADRRQIDRFFIRWVARRIGVRPLPDLGHEGAQVRAEVAAVIQACLAGLRAGENIILYPAGALSRSRYEDLFGNSAVETILRAAPDTRVVLVRTRGLWGSRFGLAHGHAPNVRVILRRGVRAILASFIWFLPRRDVTLELCEPADLPRGADRHRLNAYLERFYNSDAPPALYVPYSLWELGRRRPLPDPQYGLAAGALAAVPPATRALVYDYLRELTGENAIRDESRLAQDLGLDSLAKTELVLWLAKEFGLTEGNVDALQTVGDVLLAARGETVVSRPVELQGPPPRWFRRGPRQRVDLPPGDTLLEVFRAQVRRGPGRAVIADQLAGVRTYRDLVLAIHVLRPMLAAWPEDRLGIMLPASVGAAMTYFAALFAGKTPVMVNWTTGARNVQHALEMLDVRHVLTARPLVARLEAQGVELAGIRDRLVYLEDLRARAGRGAKLVALLRAWLHPAGLRPLGATRTGQVDSAAPAVILLTSGSETLPKAVPLTHANLLANLRDVLSAIHVYTDDCLIGFLPPFHSFGLTVTTILPILAGARAVYHASPTEAWVLARLIDLYRATLLCGTPTFLGGIIRAAGSGHLQSLRLAVTGAEKCPPRIYEALRRTAPNATILEGYGITECSPIVSVIREDEPGPGTIGRVLPSCAYAIVDVDSGAPVPPGTPGLLLVRGPSVFPGYLGENVASPFVEHAGHTWYRTGDLVTADERGVLTFRGRLKRFVKLGGEMVSLPAIEAVLERHLASEGDEGPVLAVTATPDELHPELVLVTTRDVDRATANRLIREAGLSGLHNLTRVLRVEQLPVLGTGKTDYRALVPLVTAAPA